jgi:hypothetical protein
MGLFVKNGIIDRRIACDAWCGVVLRNWNALLPVTTYARRAVGSNALWENFEYMALLSERWVHEHPTTYPAGEPRMPEDETLIERVGDVPRVG